MMERNKSRYATLIVATAVFLGIDILMLMRMPGTALVMRIGLAAVVVAVNIFYALIMNAYPRIDSKKKQSSKTHKSLIPAVPDPDGLRWITAGAWTLLFSVMWGIIIFNLTHTLSVWALIIPLVVNFLLMAAVDLAVNVRLFHTAGQPVTGMVVRYTLVELLECVLLIF